MTSRSLKIALAVSVALNVFAVTAVATGLIGGEVVERRVEQERQPRRGQPLRDMIDSLDPDVRDRVHSSLRAAALTARPDFHAAREARSQAIELARAGTFDAPRVTALMIKSREAEQRGRAILEAEAIRVLATLEPDDRAKLAPMLARHGGRMRVKDGENSAGAPPPSQ